MSSDEAASPPTVFRQTASTVTFGGEVVIARPVSLKLVSALIVGLAVVALSFLGMGGYTKKAKVAGYLIPSDGLVRVTGQQIGVVNTVRVTEGQLVKAGDALLTVSVDRGISADRGAQASVARQLNDRRESLRKDLEDVRHLASQNLTALTRKLEERERELTIIDREIETQRSRVEIANTAAGQFQELAKSKFVSQVQLLQKRGEALDQEAKQQALVRQRSSLLREIADVREDIKSHPTRSARDLSNVERALSSIEQDVLENESKREVVLTAPRDGRVMSLMATTGQNINANSVLLSIVPGNSALEAHLFAPSRAIGFVVAGQQVNLRYQAFPYQQYGHQRGVVSAVSSVAIQATETTFPVSTQSTTEPLYRIVVRLPALTHGTSESTLVLKPGMQVEGDVLVDRRSLLEWAFEPVIALKKRFA